MSGNGHSCNRKQWYSFHWCNPAEEMSARQMRIFNRGDLEEARLIKDLKAIGMEVYRPGPDGEHIELFGTIGEKQEEIIGFAGHAKGHTDGRVVGVLEAPKTPHLLEIKTANDRNFKKYKDGVKVASPIYYAQMQRYMRGNGLRRALLAVTNKNDEARHYERVRYDSEFADRLVEKEQEIILSELPPHKEFAPTWYECKWCNARDICHGGESWEVNCRTCAHADMHSEGRWTCARHKDDELSIADQRVGCGEFKPLL